MARAASRRSAIAAARGGRRRTTTGFFLAFLRELLSRDRGWKVTRVLDIVSYHETQTVCALLEEAADRIEVTWSPHYSPTHNRIERVRNHLKFRYLFHHFFGTEMGLLPAVERALNTLIEDLNLA